MGKRVLIVGGVAGGMSAATRLRRLDETAEVVVFERGPFVSFANCGLPYHLGGEIADRAKLLVQTPDRLRKLFRLDVRPDTEVTAIDPNVREVVARNRQTGETTVERYDSLILATGAAAVTPPVPGADRPGHFFLRTIPDMDGIARWVTEKAARTAVVVGGGYIGLEAAEQLHRRGLTVIVVQNSSQVLAPLDPEMAAVIHGELRKHGVGLHLSDPVARFEGPAAGETAAASVAVLTGGTRLPADVVMIAVGVKPETALAKAAGLELGITGGIKVDAHLRTSDPNIFAVGDAVEVTHGVTGRPSLIALAGPANRMGRIAADNVCGIPSAYPGSLGTAVVRVFDMTAACTGANGRQLDAAGIPYEAVHLHPNSHAGYYPGAKPIALKLLFDPDNGKVFGAQAVGEDGADKRIDVLATAIRAGMTVDDVAELELGYAPPYGSAKDPVNLAGMAAQNVRRGLVRTAQWYEVPGHLADGSVVLDVREPAERAGGAVPQSLGIPLGELRDRLGELPRDREYLVHCASGQRSYNACRILTQYGYRCRNLSGSYKTWRAAQTDPNGE